MKKHLTIYAILIVLFVIYNFFFKIQDARLNAAINILFASILFGYIAYMAYILLKKISKKS